MIAVARRDRFALCVGLMLTLSGCGGQTSQEGDADQAQMWGVPLTLDLGTFVGLFVGSALLGEIVRRVRQRQRRDEEAALKAAQDAERAYRTHKEALEIHESVTSREVFEAMEHAGPGTPARRYLLATHHRGESRYLAFSNQAGDLDRELDVLVRTALGDIAGLFPEDLGDAQDAVAQKQERRTGDRTRYDVGSYGLLSKHHTLHVIERRFCELNGITTRAAFVRDFGKAVTDVVPPTIDKASFTGESLLHDPESATDAHQRKYLEREKAVLARLGAIRLDGVDYLAGWRVGFDKDIADIGRRLHQPMIQHFARLDDYPDIAEVEA